MADGTFFLERFVDNRRLFSDCFALFYPDFMQPAFYLKRFFFSLHTHSIPVETRECENMARKKNVDGS